MGVRTPRRSVLLAPLARLLVTPSIAARTGPHPDATLIQHCAAYHAANADCERLDALVDGDDTAGWDAYAAAWKTAVAGVLSCPATTLAGRRAKATVVAQEVRSATVIRIDATISDVDWHDQLAHSLALDVLREVSA
jgi:hypothetical protein